MVADKGRVFVMNSVTQKNCHIKLQMATIDSWSFFLEVLIRSPITSNIFLRIQAEFAWFQFMCANLAPGQFLPQQLTLCQDRKRLEPLGKGGGFQPI